MSGINLVDEHSYFTYARFSLMTIRSEHFGVDGY